MQSVYNRWLLKAVILLMLLGSESTQAQDSIRPSLAGELDAASRRPVINSGYYDLKLGPALVNLSAHHDLEYNDNIDLSETERKSDLIIRPSFYANILWQISEVNALRLNLGVGYIKYLRNSQFDSSTLAIAPESELAFDIYVGDFRFTIFDQLAILQNPVDEINLSRVARFERIENSASLAITALRSGHADSKTLQVLETEKSQLNVDEIHVVLRAEAWAAAAEKDFKKAYELGRQGMRRLSFPVQNQQSEEQCRDALIRDPRDFGAVFNLCSILRKKQRWPEALQILELISQDRDCPDYFRVMRAEILASQSQWSESWDAIAGLVK
jgi:hypothetical protein